MGKGYQKKKFDNGLSMGNRKILPDILFPLIQADSMKMCRVADIHQLKTDGLCTERESVRKKGIKS